jgi:hypothetical protein
MKYIIIVFLLFPIVALAQSITGYSNGYIVKNTNDTLYGLVKIRNAFPYKIYNDVQFKKSAESQSASLSPEEVTAFVIGNEMYESKYPSKKEKKAFYQLIIRGFLSYYTMEVYSGPNFGNSYQVILQKENTEELLSYTAFNPLFPFKRKLSEYLKDYPELSAKIKYNKYNQTQLVKIVKEYNAFIEARQAQN